MFCSLLFAGISMALFLPKGNEVHTTNFELWMVVLAVQSLPYLAALLCVWLSIRPERAAKGTGEFGMSHE